ncbi:hypothetical protein Tco_0054357 [Tanacetum coccineum]
MDFVFFRLCDEMEMEMEKNSISNFDLKMACESYSHFSFDFTSIRQLLFVPLGYTFGSKMFEINEANGASTYGAGTYPINRTRNPTKLKLKQAFYQGFITVDCGIVKGLIYTDNIKLLFIKVGMHEDKYLVKVVYDYDYDSKENITEDILIGVPSTLKNAIEIRDVNLSDVKMAILEESNAILKEQLRHLIIVCFHVKLLLQFGLRKYQRVLLFTKPIADDAPKRVTYDIDKYVDAVYVSGFLTDTFSMMLDFYSDPWNPCISPNRMALFVFMPIKPVLADDLDAIENGCSCVRSYVRGESGKILSFSTLIGNQHDVLKEGKISRSLDCLTGQSYGTSDKSSRAKFISPLSTPSAGNHNPVIEHSQSLPTECTSSEYLSDSKQDQQNNKITFRHKKLLCDYNFFIMFNMLVEITKLHDNHISDSGTSSRHKMDEVEQSRARIVELKRIRCIHQGRYGVYVPALHKKPRRPIRRIQELSYTCMTRISTEELFPPFEEPEQEFRSSWKLFKTPTLDESSSPKFGLFYDLEENSEEVVETMPETMEEYICLDHEDVNGHIEKVLEIVDLFHILNITEDQIMLRAFPMSLTEAASHWLKNEPSGSITTWEASKTKFLSKYCLPTETEVTLFYNGLDILTQQILDLKGAIPTKTAPDAKDVSYVKDPTTPNTVHLKKKEKPLKKHITLNLVYLSNKEGNRDQQVRDSTIEIMQTLRIKNEGKQWKSL